MNLPRIVRTAEPAAATAAINQLLETRMHKNLTAIVTAAAIGPPVRWSTRNGLRRHLRRQGVFRSADRCGQRQRRAFQRGDAGGAAARAGQVHRRYEGEAFETRRHWWHWMKTKLLAKRSAAYAQLAAADAELRNAGVQYSRELWSPQSSNAPGGMAIPNLFDQMFTRPAEDFFGQRDRGAERSADLYASSTRMEQARSAMFRAQSEIRAIDAKLRDAKSLAPFDGVIVEKFVEEGDTVQPGQPMLKFADVTWLQIEIDVPARLAQGLRPMDVLQNAATFDDHPEPVAVRVAQVLPMADIQRHTIKVKFDIPQGVSKPGMYAKVLIPDTTGPSKSQLPVIPSTAIRYRGSLPVVYIQNAEGSPELRMIRQGKRLDNGMTMVLSGIAPGDRVCEPGRTS